MKHVTEPDSLCDNFYQHELVQRFGPGKKNKQKIKNKIEKKTFGPENCYPLRLFFDFAKLDNSDSVLNIFVSCVHRKKRTPVISLRKKEMCRCGCRGAHTLQPLWADIAWMFRVSGLVRRFPRKDSRQTSWPADSVRAELAGLFFFLFFIFMLFHFLF